MKIDYSGRPIIYQPIVAARTINGLGDDSSVSTDTSSSDTSSLDWSKIIDSVSKAATSIYSASAASDAAIAKAKYAAQNPYGNMLANPSLYNTGQYSALYNTGALGTNNLLSGNSNLTPVLLLGLAGVAAFMLMRN